MLLPECSAPATSLPPCPQENTADDASKTVFLVLYNVCTRRACVYVPCAQRYYLISLYPDTTAIVLGIFLSLMTVIVAVLITGLITGIILLKRRKTWSEIRNFLFN